MSTKNTKGRRTKKKNLLNIRKTLKENEEENKAKAEKQKKAKDESERDDDLLEQYQVFNFDKKGINITGIDTQACAEMIYNEYDYHFIHVIGETEGKTDIWFWNKNKGYYEPHGIDEIKNKIQKVIGTRWHGMTSYHVREIIEKIRRMDYVKKVDMEPSEHLVLLEDVIYNLKTGETMEPTPEYMFINRLPIKYDKNAKSPKIMSFLDYIFENEPEKKDLFQEIAGYCLLRNYDYHHYFVFYGTGRNGKGTALYLLESLVGDVNLSHVTLHDLVRDRFAPVDLHGKMINTTGEISNDYVIKDSSLLKTVSSGEPIRVQQKNKPAYNIRPYAKIIFNGNEIPQTLDHSEGFYSRWIILVFDRFIKPEERISGYKYLLTTPEEMSGFFNWAVEGLKRLCKNGHFTYERWIEENGAKIEKYEYYSNIIEHFLRERCKKDSDLTIDTQELLQALNHYINERKGGGAMTPNKLTAQLDKHNIEARNKRMPDESIGRHYFGIDLIENIERRRKEVEETAKEDSEQATTDDFIKAFETQQNYKRK